MRIDRLRGFPAWAILLFWLGSLFLIVGGVISILGDKHEGSALLGGVCIAVGVAYIILGGLRRGRWWSSDSHEV